MGNDIKHKNDLICISKEVYISHKKNANLHILADYLVKHFNQSMWTPAQCLEDPSIYAMLSSRKFRLTIEQHSRGLIAITGELNSKKLAIIGAGYKNLYRHKYKNLVYIEKLLSTNNFESIIDKHYPTLKFKNNKGKL